MRERMKTMKKKILAFTLCAVMLLSLAGCGSKTGGTSADSGSSGASVGASSGGQSSGTAEYTFIIAHADPEDGPLHKNLLEFEKYVEENTSGRMDVQVFGNGLLGGDREVLEAINLGTVQMGNMASSNLTAYGDKFGIYELPFLFNSFEAATAAYDGELGEIYNGWLAENGFVCYGVFTYGWRALSNKVREVWTPDDLAGIKIRVMEVPMYIDAFTQLGANPTPMSWNEIYTGLQQGTIEAQDNSPEQTWLAKFYEVQPYYTTLNHTLSNGLAICKKDYMDSLPEDIRQVIIDGMEICCAAQRESSVVLEQEYLDKMRDAGVTVCELSTEQRALFKEKVSALYDQYRGIVGDEVMDLALSYSK